MRNLNLELLPYFSSSESWPRTLTLNCDPAASLKIIVLVLKVDIRGGGYIRSGYLRRWTSAAVVNCGSGYLRRWIFSAGDICGGGYSARMGTQ